MILGKRIKELRRERGLTQQQLGDQINVTNGTRNPTLQTLTDLAEFFGVDLAYFLGMDTFAIAEDREDYKFAMCNEEIEFIVALRRNESLYAQLIDNPKRLIQLINQKVK